MCTEGDLGGLTQGVTTPHRFNCLKTLNNPYNVFAKVRGTGFSTYIPVCYGPPSLLRYIQGCLSSKDTFSVPNNNS